MVTFLMKGLTTNVSNYWIFLVILIKSPITSAAILNKWFYLPTIRKPGLDTRAVNGNLNGIR